MEILLKPIGVIHTSKSDDEIRDAIKGVEGVVEVFQEFSEGLEGIDGFSHIILIAYLHKVSKLSGTLKIRPRKWLRLGIDLKEVPEVGVFASDSPVRPNPIALTIVKLKKREGRFLYVEGLDLFNGTPVLDIKPYTPSRQVRDITLPEWYRALLDRIKSVFPQVEEL
ncbi:MAG: tRNA (N6-threonylcarbamoyladenosine(37)-N6)-methyltransferase TrmO [Zestosphaera tikiterensis]|uniref:tRNA (N6-threonylcarbamoyladenosine(37)-N6)-methyltransferase TrmO n=1 Tax=Zestosphaera tikiterensis TaxID=1973259 RepID=A0A2R7Y7X6_9CREN|nr:MAG: tRNA (N6-threonylcarbamoyladenosine(37)-N6)-methyltransferase TrmO [Zestosphaera tikiterensis]